MSDSRQISESTPEVLRVSAGKDLYGEHRGLGISAITFKLPSQDNFFILENTFHEKGGPARHLHYEQDEWFYVVESEFIFEIGQEKFRLNPGDSLFAPPRVPHV